MKFQSRRPASRTATVARTFGTYIRVSTDKQVQVFEGSLETQQYRMQEFVKLRNIGETKWGKIVDFYIEEGYSAGTDRRPQYQRLLADIRKKKINLILVADLSRLSRSVRDFAQLQDELDVNGASIFSMKEQFDTGTPAGRMMLNMMISMAQFEREQTSERVSINGHARAMRGYLNGGRTVLGYKRNVDKPGTMMVHKEEAEIVKAIFKVFLEEGSRSKAINRLHEMQIYPKRSLKKLDNGKFVRWTTQTLGNVLNQVAYIGLREVNKTYKNVDPAFLKPWQRHQMVKAAWPAIIDESDFLEAQRLLEEAGERERAKLSKSERKVFYLSHLLSCGECGRALVGQAAHGRSGNVHRYYYHSRKFNDKECCRPRLHANELEEKLLQHLKAGLTAAGYTQKLEAALMNSAKENETLSKSGKSRLAKELKRITDEIAGVWQLQGSSNMNADALKLTSDRLNALAQTKQSIERQLQLLDDSTDLETLVSQQARFVEVNLTNLLKGWQKAPSALKKRLLRRAIRRIVVTRDEMKITFWLSAEERDGSTEISLDGSAKPEAEILEFRRRSRLLEAQGTDQNSLVGGSPIGKFGSGRGTRTPDQRIMIPLL